MAEETDPQEHDAGILLPDGRLRLEAQISIRGYSVRYVEFCEDSRSPGLLGMFTGVTDHELKVVKIKTHDRTPQEMVETLAHELRHIEDPSWDCGSRDVFGRKGRGGSGTSAGDAVPDRSYDAKVLLWFCPVDQGHRVRWQRVESGANVPHCVEPGCGQVGEER